MCRQCINGEVRRGGGGGGIGAAGGEEAAADGGASWVSGEEFRCGQQAGTRPQNPASQRPRFAP